MNASVDAFLTGHGWSDADRSPIAQDSSARRYLRLNRGPDTAVLMMAPPEEDAAFRKFIVIADWLRAAGLSAPEIFAEDMPAGLMLIEDFGTAVMAELASDPGVERPLYTETRAVLDRLAALSPPPDLPVLDASALVDQTGLIFDELPESEPLRAAWMRGLREVLAPSLAEATVPALRDLHAENVMWLADRSGVARVGLLDFQDAVLAPPGYDLASLIDDPRRVVPTTLRSDLIAAHADATGHDRAALALQVDLLSLARNLRILGIFRRAARSRHRPAYLNFLPRTAALIRRASGVPGVAPFRPMIEEMLRLYGVPDPVTS